MIELTWGAVVNIFLAGANFVCVIVHAIERRVWLALFCGAACVFCLFASIGIAVMRNG